MMGEAKLGRHLILIFHVKEIPLNLLYTKEATWGADGGGMGWFLRVDVHIQYWIPQAN